MLVKALTCEEMEAILPRRMYIDEVARRDYALLLTLYNTGARVSEIIRLEKTNIVFGASTFVQIHGKGRKRRNNSNLAPHSKLVAKLVC